MVDVLSVDPQISHNIIEGALGCLLERGASKGRGGGGGG